MCFASLTIAESSNQPFDTTFFYSTNFVRVAISLSSHLYIGTEVKGDHVFLKVYQTPSMYHSGPLGLT